MRRIWAIILLLLLVASVAPVTPVEASREADTTFRFIIDETVAVFIRGCTSQSVDMGITRDRAKHYVYFPCPLEVVTAAITDYELRFAAMAYVRQGLLRRRVTPTALEIRLDQAGMTGLTCLPSSDVVEVNEKVVKFVPAVEFPNTLLLLRGCNNTANPTTTAPIEARVDLRRLPSDIRSYSQVVFTLRFIIIER